MRIGRWSGKFKGGFDALVLAPFASAFNLSVMTAKKFYDWQTAGGTDDVMLMVNALEGADIPWCAIGGVAVNHWAAEPMVTQDVDFVVATDAIERAVAVLAQAGFRPEKLKWSVNFT